MIHSQAQSSSARTSLALFAAPLLGLAFLLGGSGCTKSYPNCDGDKTCASHNEVCVDGRCRQCRDDSQCSALDACMTCQANECVRKPNCCKGDFDCPTGRCTNNTCVSECSVNSDCPEGKRCNRGRCEEPTDSCSGDTDCPAGQKCKNGACTTACDLVDVLFDFDEYAVRLDQEATVNANASCLQSTTYESAIVQGHTDERGSDEYNLGLGERRANSVAKQYKLLGVKNVGRVISFGEEKPSCTTPNESCWKLNRRAETVIR